MSRIEQYHTVTRRLIIMTLICVLLFASIFAVSYVLQQRFLLTSACFLCGIVGGFVSIQQRLPKVSNTELGMLTKSWFQILLVPIFGGVFALVLYCVFLSGIISGHLFPEFFVPQAGNNGPDDQFMWDIFSKTYPKTTEDFAKLLFWCFVAGFSERFVPQIINKTLNGTADGKTASTTK